MDRTGDRMYGCQDPTIVTFSPTKDNLPSATRSTALLHFGLEEINCYERTLPLGGGTSH